MSLQAVTFDFWETLVRTDNAAMHLARRVAVAEVLAANNFPAELNDIEQAFDEAWSRYSGAWATGEQFTGHHAAELVLDLLGHSPSAEVRRDVIDAYVSAGRDVELELTYNVADSLRAIKAMDLRIGIICDVGLTPSPILRKVLDRHGVLSLFDHWSFSDEVGVYKPDPQIFEHALSGLGGIAPSNAVHIGDLRRTDIAGAIGMGMHSIRYCGANDDPAENGPEADHVLTDHADLPAYIASLL